MGRDALKQGWSDEELAIIRRRETLSNGSIWRMQNWDYTEWEEFMEEINPHKTRIDVV